MFRFGVLRHALIEAEEQGLAVTDEASAVEHLGMAPRLVEGHSDNIKVTRPGDLEWAAWVLQQIMDD